MNSNAQTPAESSGERVAKRRRLILAGAGALAALGGAGLAWWRLQPHAAAPGALAEVGVSGAGRSRPPRVDVW